jgi:hypothetical protein
MNQSGAFDLHQAQKICEEFQYLQGRPMSDRRFLIDRVAVFPKQTDPVAPIDPVYQTCLAAYGNTDVAAKANPSADGYDVYLISIVGERWITQNIRHYAEQEMVQYQFPEPGFNAPST